MLPESFTLEIVTPERQLVRETLHDVQLPSANGTLGILPGHAPLLTELGLGELRYRKGHDSFSLIVIHGFAEVLPTRLIVLAERGERAEEIDLERAQKARERAEKRLAKPGYPELDWERARFALERALIRVQVAAKGGAVAAHEEHHAAP